MITDPWFYACAVAAVLIVAGLSAVATARQVAVPGHHRRVIGAKLIYDAAV